MASCCGTLSGWENFLGSQRDLRLRIHGCLQHLQAIIGNIFHFHLTCKSENSTCCPNILVIVCCLESVGMFKDNFPFRKPGG